MDNNFNRSRREDAYQASAKLSKYSTSYEVMKVLETLVSNAIPKAKLLNHRGDVSSNYQALSFSAPDNSCSWIVIIKDDAIRKNGNLCLKVYRLRNKICFSDYYALSFNHPDFPEECARICAYSKELLHNYYSLLSPEGLVIEMLCNQAQN